VLCVMKKIINPFLLLDNQFLTPKGV